MQTKYKRHHPVILLRDADPEYVEYHNPEHEEEVEDQKKVPIKKGMSGAINLLLPNGKYHVEVQDKNGNIIAYCQMDEDDLGSKEK